jgi:deoxyribonuclease IV
VKARASAARPRLGSHVSVEGGYERAIERSEALGAEALQIFVRSPRQWSGRAVPTDEIARFRRRLDETGLARFALAHASYLINLAAKDPIVRERSIAGLADELERTSALGIPALVLHPGAHLGSGEEVGLELVASGLDAAYAAAGGVEVRVLLEITAGQGTCLGYRFEHLGRILARSRQRERIGVCFDTCHAVAAGYDLRTTRGYARTMAELDREIGLDRLLAFHLNDSRHARASRRDRHEHIGHGAAGLSTFRSIVRDPRFANVPMVLETPKGVDLAEDRANLAVLRRLAGIQA